jgi:hypothetical protein
MTNINSNANYLLLSLKIFTELAVITPKYITKNAQQTLIITFKQSTTFLAIVAFQYISHKITCNPKLSFLNIDRGLSLIIILSIHCVFKALFYSLIPIKYGAVCLNPLNKEIRVMTLSPNKEILFLSMAVIISNSASAIEPAAIPIGEMSLYPSINIVTGHDDNILATETDKVSSWVTRITPNLLLEAEDNNTLLRVNYSFEKGILHSSSDDNYLDHNLTSSVNYIINSRNRFDIQASLIKGHEARGEEDGGAISTADKPLEYDLNSIQGIYTYGRREAKGQIELRTRYQDKDFTNFDSITSTRDFDQLDFAAKFKYKLTAKTSAVATVSQSKIDYDESNRDSTTNRYLLGAVWDATAKTTGKINVGWSEKDFKDASLTDADGGTWDAAINWNPKTYSTFTFNTGQEFGESTTTDTHIDTKSYGLSWQHFWKDHIKSNIGYNTQKENFSNSTRKDTTDTFVVSLNYETRRWLNFGIGYTLTDKDSNFNNVSFKKNTVMLTAQGSL